jgi:leucyl-tRNA synthetase
MREVLEKMVLLLAPFAPYIAEEMWEELGRTGPVFKQKWPEYNADLAREAEAEIVVQVNGKVRGRITVPFGTGREALEKAAIADDAVKRFLGGRKAAKVVVVPDKLVNTVVKG